MTASYAIMAHPERENAVLPLIEQLGPGVATAWDWKNDRWDTGKRALELTTTEADWHVVIQDDAVLAPGFCAEAEAVLEELPPDGPVSFYFGAGKPYPEEVHDAIERALEAGASFIEAVGPLWGVAVAIPVSLLDEVIERANKVQAPQYDLRLSIAFAQMHRRCTYTVPSLVDHDDGESLTSPVSHVMTRRAHLFGHSVNAHGPTMRADRMDREHYRAIALLEAAQRYGITIKWT